MSLFRKPTTSHERGSFIDTYVGPPGIGLSRRDAERYANANPHLVDANADSMRRNARKAKVRKALDKVEDVAQRAHASGTRLLNKARSTGNSLRSKAKDKIDRLRGTSKKGGAKQVIRKVRNRAEAARKAAITRKMNGGGAKGPPKPPRR